MNEVNSQLLTAAKYLVGLDSDGCVFDTMEDKHRLAFVPALIEVYELDHIAGIVEEVWLFVNLYSRDRGINRFPGLVRAMDELRRHPVLGRFPGVLSAILPDTSALRSWMARCEHLSNESLINEINRLKEFTTNQDEAIYELERCLEWSRLVNEYAAKHVSQPKHFRGVNNFLAMLRPDADLIGQEAAAKAALEDRETIMIVISQSPQNILAKQWSNAGFDKHVDFIHGQEAGAKSKVLKTYQDGGFGGSMLFVGDAPGDLDAARAAGAWFFPIVPRYEAESWSRLSYEGWPLFAAGCYNREYQNRLLDEFFGKLPVRAPWEEQNSLRRVS
jgi:phosphoglycolate phosphatase-like HAD superfamily hydrolase